jgi:cell division protein FtsA
MKKGKLIVGLDVGTTKTCAVVGEVLPNGKPQEGFTSNANNGGSGSAYGSVDIVGFGSSPSEGLRKGVVVNIESTAESIQKAVNEAELMAGIDIKAVHVSIAGGHIQSFPSQGIIAVRDREIGQRDMERVIDAARVIAIPLDREIIHVIPECFTVDGQGDIRDPRGMGGVRLEADVRIITGAVTSIQNLIKSCQRAGLDVIDVVLEPLASAEAILSREEKELGAGIVDIGGGTTDIALFDQGSVCHTAVLGIGGNNFTNDVAIGLRVQASEAERIKKRYGCSQISMVRQDDEMEVNYPGDKPRRRIPRQHLIEILQPRSEELFHLVKEEIVKSGFHGMLTSGVVLSGGAALMKGMDTLAENILELPVRVGSPAGAGGIADSICSPMYATGVGLVQYGGKEVIGEYKFHNGSILNGVTMKVKGFVKGVFNFSFDS